MATITKRGNTYKITVSCGYDSGGKQIRQHMTWKPAPGMTKRQIEKELERQKVLFEEKVNSGLFITSDIKLGDFIPLWVEKYLDVTARERTKQGYKGMLPRIKTALGHIKLSKLQPHHLNDFYAQLTDLGLSPATVRKYHAILSSMCSTAVKWGMIAHNPCERADPPKLKRQEPVFLNELQAGRLLQLLKDEEIQFRTAITLLMFSGLRRGEVCGLEWEDFYFDHRMVDVCRTSQYTQEKGIYTDDTKNFTSRRTVKLPAFVFDLLAEYRVWQNKERERLGDQWQESGRLFTQWNGLPIHPDTLTKQFSKFVAKHSDELPKGLHIHSLRHTNATLLIAQGVNIRTVSSRLGHGQTSTTMNIYAHAIQSADEKAAETLENILKPNKKTG